MTKPILVRLAISCIVLSWWLSAPHSSAQTSPQRPRGISALGSAPQAASQADGAPPATAPAYTFSIFDFPGTFLTNGFGINSGAASSKIEIVGGIGNDSMGFSGGFLMHYAKTKGTTTQTFEGVNFPGATQQLADAVNDSGQIAGQYADSSGAFHGFLQSGGEFTTIDVPFSDATWTQPEGINNSGQVVGGWLDGTTSHGFLFSGGSYTSFDYPAAVFTVGLGINNHGEIAGFYGDTGGVYHGFTLSGGTYTSIDVPGATATEINGINDSGDVVGLYCLTSKCAENFDTFQGFVSIGGTITPVTIAGAHAFGPVGINNKGDISGVYYDAIGRHAFLGTPNK